MLDKANVRVKFQKRALIGKIMTDKIKVLWKIKGCKKINKNDIKCI